MPATKTQRTLRVYREGAALKVVVSDGRGRKAYAVDASRTGATWWNASEQRLYDVRCSRGKAASCTCDGFKFGNVCRHMAGTDKLVAMGVLDLDGPPEGAFQHNTETE